jgi:hypothetical protein
MPLTVMIHLMNEDPIVAEVAEMPDPADLYVACENPRRRDGRDVTYLLAELKTLIVPWHRVHCLEILSAEEEEEAVTFVRE